MRFSSFVEVNLGMLAENFNRIQSLAPKAEVLPMVKADAYGNGLISVSQHLVKECGAKTLGCATIGEALALRENGISSDIIVFSDTEINDAKIRENFISSGISPVLHQASDLEIIESDSSLAKIPLHVKLNTGMNRLGLTDQDLEKFLPLFKKRGIKHLITHFARSGDRFKEGDKTHKQLNEFHRMKKFLTDAGVSIEKTSVSNSGAIEQKVGVEESFVRPGLMLYGPPSVTEPVIWKGHQVSKWVTKVLSTFQVKKGTPVGYGVNVADKDSFMAVIPLGYGDGFFTYYSGSKVTINGITGKVFGRVNMDMAFIQFDPEAEKHIHNNDRVEIWSHDNESILEFATQNKTHCYQLMCGISGRIPRIYKVK